MSKSYKPKDDKELDEGFMKLAMWAGRVIDGPMYRPPSISSWVLAAPEDRELSLAKYVKAVKLHDIACEAWIEEERKQFPEMYKTGDE
jgi:hypothetical protein